MQGSDEKFDDFESLKQFFESSMSLLLASRIVGDDSQCKDSVCSFIKHAQNFSSTTKDIYQKISAKIMIAKSYNAIGVFEEGFGEISSLAVLIGNMEEVSLKAGLYKDLFSTLKTSLNSITEKKLFYDSFLNAVHQSHKDQTAIFHLESVKAFIGDKEVRDKYSDSKSPLSKIYSGLQMLCFGLSDIELRTLPS